jgi:fructosamine-3-kinase
VKEIPEALLQVILHDLGQLGDHSGIRRCMPVSGGCIHSAYRVDTSEKSYFLKWNADSQPGIFLTEKQGLDLIRETQTVRVPEVYSAAETTGDQPAYILMDFIRTPAAGQQGFDQALLGAQLAALHRVSSGAAYGLDHDNYIGRIQQTNTWRDNWIDFFRENRLLPQIRLAEMDGLLPVSRRKRLADMVDRLEQWLAGVQRQPSLLHGDLWGGNVIAGQNREPVLLDPAVYYGDREIDLAFTEMFGGFDNRFYEAYREAWPLEPGYETRKQLYNLYHLINHLNHFGESYGPSIDNTLDLFIV